MTNEIVNKTCPICTSQAQLFPRIGDNEHYICPKCGEYKISETDLAILRNKPLNEHERNSVSQAIRSHSKQNECLLTPDSLIADARRKPSKH